MQRPERARLPTTRRAGMTLLEVLAAVAVLGLLYTVLAGIAMQGLRAEGEARRRLEASLLADEVLAELEGSIEGGAAPPIGQTASERDGFGVEVTVSALELSLPESARTLRGGGASAEPGRSFLGAAQRGAVAPLRRIDLRVAWIEGQDEQAVTRATLAFDREAVRAELDELDFASEEQGPLSGPQAPPPGGDASPASNGGED